MVAPILVGIGSDAIIDLSNRTIKNGTELAWHLVASSFLKDKKQPSRELVVVWKLNNLKPQDYFNIAKG